MQWVRVTGLKGQWFNRYVMETLLSSTPLSASNQNLTVPSTSGSTQNFIYYILYKFQKNRFTNSGVSKGHICDHRLKTFYSYCYFQYCDFVQF